MNGGLHIHLDPIGGIAGDMFVAALLDAWPELALGVIEAIAAAGLGDEIKIERQAHNDGILDGSRFIVSKPGEADRLADRHDHAHWRAIRGRLSKAPLPRAVSDRAIAIFALLAEAEAAVHGVDVDDVTFHEVGAWDSIADIVAAAFLIEKVGADHWSVGPLPIGGGRVRTAHGDLPVPAPATARLLEGFSFHDDGQPGERVTPTGAAILRQIGAFRQKPFGEKRLMKSGYGFGSRRLSGMSNVLRVIAFDGTPTSRDEIAVLSFEVDDQTPEDLAIGLERLRSIDGVFDLVQMPVFGKKGRLSTSLRLLVQPDRIDPVINACFAETTTIGLRWHIERRATLARDAVTTEDGTRVKRAERPGLGKTAKVESDDLASIASHIERMRKRHAAESEALGSERTDGEGSLDG